MEEKARRNNLSCPPPHTGQVANKDNAMPYHYTINGYDRHDIHILWKRKQKTKKTNRKRRRKHVDHFLRTRDEIEPSALRRRGVKLVRTYEVRLVVVVLTTNSQIKGSWSREERWCGAFKTAVSLVFGTIYLEKKTWNLTGVPKTGLLEF